MSGIDTRRTFAVVALAVFSLGVVGVGVSDDIQLMLAGRGAVWVEPTGPKDAHNRRAIACRPNG